MSDIVKRRTPVPCDEWRWLARPAHFIGAYLCQFRLGTVVGDFIVSSVGDMRVSPTGCFADAKQRPIGHERTHETMVFFRGLICACGCGQPLVDFSSIIEMYAANSDAECIANHVKACQKYAGLMRSRNTKRKGKP